MNPGGVQGVPVELEGRRVNPHLGSTTQRRLK
jgi:hypothetical protein